MATTKKAPSKPPSVATVKTTKPVAKAAAKPAVKSVAKPAKPVAAKAAKTEKAPAAKPKAAAKKPAKPTGNTVPAQQRAHYVEVAAFYIAERRGFAPGDTLQDWIAAEAEIDRLLAEGRLG